MASLRYVSDSPNAPQAIGPYSQAVVAGNLVYLSGQIPLDPKSGAIVEGGIEVQAEQVMQNIAAVLTHLKIDFSHVMKTTIFLTNLSNFAVVNSIYEKNMKGFKPARSTIQVAALPKGSEVEIEMIAVLSV